MSESTFVKHIECDICGSSDANSLYTDGHTHCFSCGHTTTEAHSVNHKQTVTWLIDGEVRALRKRGITEETCQKWNYKIGEYKGRPVQIATYYDLTYKPIAQKVRFPDKEFTCLGKPKKMGLYGMHLWRDGGKRVVVTEGEIDALTVSQLQGNKWPVVSVPNGAGGAANSVAKDLEWLEQFDEVVFLFDMDEPGKEASIECAELLTPGKAKIASLPLKDANEMLLAGRGDEVVKAIWDAKTYRPDSILSDLDFTELLDYHVDTGLSYPWEAVTKTTYGIRTHEIISLLSGSGMGKTEVFKEIAHHLLTIHKQKVGIFFLEEQPAHTLRCLLGKTLNARIYLPGVEYDAEQAEYELANLSKSLFIFDHRGVSDFEVILPKIRYLVHSGVQYIFLDHITAMAEGKGEDNINSRIHYIMEELNKVTQNLPVTIFLISHTKKSEGKPIEEGGRVTLDMAYGSGAIKQRSNFVFALERNQQSTDDVERDSSRLRVLKDRLTGSGVGKVIPLTYNQETGRLLEEGISNPFNLPGQTKEDF